MCYHPGVRCWWPGPGGGIQRYQQVGSKHFTNDKGQVQKEESCGTAGSGLSSRWIVTQKSSAFSNSTRKAHPRSSLPRPDLFQTGPALLGVSTATGSRKPRKPVLWSLSDCFSTLKVIKEWHQSP